MSEFQYVGFRAIDCPVSEKNLEYMNRQSSRAEITPSSFDNQYNYGDFRGDAFEMLRRGYDIHLHYANYGIRRLMIRLPQGLPDAKASKPYFGERALRFVDDKAGQGGALVVQPFHEPGDHEELWDVDKILDQLVPLRAEILEGDLRPLYLAHLAVACDSEHDPEETVEAPLPAGLDKLTPAQQSLAEFYGISEAIVAAAAQESPPQAVQLDPRKHYAEWLRRQDEPTKTAWLARCMLEPQSNLRGELLAAFRKSWQAPLWPTVVRGRTIAELQDTADEIHQEKQRKSAEQAARQHVKKLVDMAKDPNKVLHQTEELASQRTARAYEQIAQLLATLREALGSSELCEQQAQKLRDLNPTAKQLVAALRSVGFLPKSVPLKKKQK